MDNYADKQEAFAIPPDEVYALGACNRYDPEIFYPKRAADSELALAICNGCPVRDVCLRWALDTGQQHGIWGGATSNARRRIRRLSGLRG